MDTIREKYIHEIYSVKSLENMPDMVELDLLYHANVAINVHAGIYIFHEFSGTEEE